MFVCASKYDHHFFGMIQRKRTQYAGTRHFTLLFLLLLSLLCLSTFNRKIFANTIYDKDNSRTKKCDNKGKEREKKWAWRQQLNNAKDFNNGLRFFLSSIESLFQQKATTAKFNAISNHILKSFLSILFCVVFFLILAFIAISSSCYNQPIFFLITFTHTLSLYLLRL